MREYPKAHYSWKVTDKFPSEGLFLRIFTGEHIYGMFHIVESNTRYGYRDIKYTLVPIDPFGPSWTSYSMEEGVADDFIKEVLRLPPGKFKQDDVNNFYAILQDIQLMEDVL